jgi:NitT/TauT family transport system permease protein
VVLLGVWELAVRILSVKEYILPAPTSVAGEVWTQRQLLWDGTMVTGSEIVLGFLLAVGFSLPVAMLVTSFRFIERSIYPLLVISQTIPKIAVAPLFVVWFGFSMTSKVLMAFLISFFPILVDAIVGLRSISPESRDLMRSMGASRLRIMKDLRLPASLPYLMSGLKVAITLAVVGAVVGEFVGSTEGLGYQLLEANSSLNTRLLFADIVVLTVIGMVLYYAVELLERLLIPWHSSKRSGHETPSH